MSDEKIPPSEDAVKELEALVDNTVLDAWEILQRVRQKRESAMRGAERPDDGELETALRAGGRGASAIDFPER